MAKRMHIADIYASEMDSLHFGHALWNPSGLDDSDDIQIGDVGYIFEGNFVRMFNIKYAANHASNQRAGDLVPPDHQVYESALGELRESRSIEPGFLGSKGVKAKKISASGGGEFPAVAGALADYEFSFREQQGAFLYINHAAMHEVVSRNKPMERYLRTHWRMWNHYATEELGINMGNDGPILVHGHRKTADWTVAATRSTTLEQSAGIEAGANIRAAGSVSLRWSQSASSATTLLSRSGPQQRVSLPQVSDADTSSSTPPILNQCIFLQAYKVKLRFGFFKISAAAGPEQLPPPSPPDYESELAVVEQLDDDAASSYTPESSFYSTLDVVLDYILQNSDAEIAIACHSDIDSLLSGIQPPHDFAQFLDIIRPRISVDDEKVGTLDLEELIRQERIRKITSQGPAILDMDNDPSASELQDGPDDCNQGSCDSRGGLQGYGKLTIGNRPAPLLQWPHLVFRDKSPSSTLPSCNSMALSPDGTLLAAGFSGFHSIVWTTKDGQLVNVFGGHTDEVWSVRFSPDGTRLVSGSVDGTALVWNVFAEDPQPILFLEGQEHVVLAVYSPDAKYIATGHVDCSVKIWDANKGHCVRNLGGHLSPLESLDFTSDSKRLISCANDVANIWDVDSGEHLALMKGHMDMMWNIAISHNGDRVATTSHDNTCRIWSSTKGEELVTITDHTTSVTSVAWSPDDNAVVSASTFPDYAVTVNDSWSGQLLHVFKHEASVGSVAWSPIAEFICSGADDGRVKLWSTKLGGIVAQYQGQKAKVVKVQFSPDGYEIFYASDDASIRSWSVLDAVRLY